VTTTTTITTPRRGRHSPELNRRLANVAIGSTCVLFAWAGAVIWVPSLDDARVVPTVLAPIALVTILATFGWMRADRQLGPQRVLTFTAMTMWAPLIVEDTRWSVTIMVIYVLAWSTGGLLGPALAIVTTIVWTGAWLNSGSAPWVVAIPCSVLATSIFASWAAERIAEDNRTKDDLIARLETSRRQLADAERKRGTLEERARFASEVHDTLAQGFTSIVLLSRYGKRTLQDPDIFEQIETTALENLDAARRLVENASPTELDDEQLTDALRRRLHAVVGEDRSTMSIIGSPRSYRGAVEITAYRAAQEAILNTQRHAAANRVQLAVHHLDYELLIEVVDDGTGFNVGQPNGQSVLSGGQGLKAMRDRVRSLGGDVHITSAPGQGTTVSVRLPTQANQ
jgi:signal transduction histidine kinase